MKTPNRILLTAAILAGVTLSSAAQDDGGGVRRRSGSDRNRRSEATTGPQLTDRMQAFYSDENSTVGDADVQWMRVIYRAIDLEKDQNAPLYFPEEPIEGQENLFRIIMRLMASGQLKAYEYLDGREVFTDQYGVKMRDVLDRFHIPFTEAKGSTERNPRYTIDESDVPTNEVLSYYIIERWEYDTRQNRLRPRVEAICPVLHRTGDFGGEAVKYPMFWVKFSDLRPWLAQQTIFTSDDNNLPTCTYDDFFNLTMYDGEIYKTRNLKNKSLMQLHPDPDDMKRAQDSIQGRLDDFEKKLWVPSREEVIAMREAREKAKQGADTTDVTPVVKEKKSASDSKTPRSTKRSTKQTKQAKPKEPKQPKNTGTSNANHSVRRRK